MKKSVIGIDIGSSSIKVAEVSSEGSRASLILGKIGTYNSLKEALGSINYKNSPAVVTINSPRAAVKRIVLPSMPAGELRDAVNMDARTRFPFSIEGSIVDFEIAASVVEKLGNKLALLVFVSPEETIKKAIGLCEENNLRPSQIIHNSAALRNLFNRMNIIGGGSTAFLDIGHTFSELVIFNGKSIRFNRKLPVSGKTFTDGMAGVFTSDSGRVELSPPEAEALKKRIGIPEEGSRKDLIDSKISYSHLFSMLRPVAEKLTNEIERSFDYYREETSGLRVERLVLFGGGSLLKGLDKFLRESLGIDVKPGNPLEVFGGASLKNNQEGALYAAAIGAALSDLKGANLLPIEYRQKRKLLVKKGALKAGLSAALTIMALVFVGLRTQLTAVENKIYSAGLELAALRPQVELAARAAAASGILKDEPYWADALKELSALTADNISINELEMSGQTMELRGEISPKEGNAEKELSEFVESIEKGIFKEARLLSSKKRGSVCEFDISCRAE